MQRWTKALIGGLTICLLLSLVGFEADCNNIRQQVLRLHILANSDSDTDQTLKLAVRDAVTTHTANWTEHMQSREEATAHISGRLEEIEQIAQQTVYDNGFDYPVKAYLCNMYFDTRVYDNVTMPAGNYDAVRIEIGEAAGKNWWCVIYPPMCIGSAVGEQPLEDVLTKRQMSVVTGDKGYVVKFKVVEIFEWLLNYFR